MQSTPVSRVGLPLVRPGARTGIQGVRMPKKLLPREALRQRIELYLNGDELHRIDIKASAAGLSRSAFLRKVALGQRVEAVPTANAERWQSLARLAGNLNQIAHAINAGRADGVDPRMIDALQQEVRALRRALLGVIG